MAGENKQRWAPLAVEYGAYEPLMAGSIDGTDTLPHDHGVVRAMQAKYRPNKQVQGEPKKTLFVSRLSHNTTEEQLKELFAVYGKIERCRLIRDIVTGRSKGYAFVEFKHKRDTESAFLKAHKALINDVQILVEYECERTLAGWTPRRFGGGFGGKKESGQLRFGGRDRPFRKPIMLNSRPLGRAREESLRERGHY